MLRIEEAKLRDLLFRRRKHIKTRRTTVETVLSLLGFIITFVLSGFMEAPAVTKAIVVSCGIIYLVVFGFSVYGSNYSVDAFYRDICSVAEKNHSFSILVFRDISGIFPANYLLSYERRWKCWLFPFIRTNIDNDRASVENYIKTVFGIKNFTIDRVTEQDFTKHSVSSNMEKTYHHTFYLVSFCASDSLLKKRAFQINREKFKWFTIQEIKADKRIMERNSDNVSYVERTF